MLQNARMENFIEWRLRILIESILKDQSSVAIKLITQFTHQFIKNKSY